MASHKLKVCGITNLADARFAAGAGVHYLGFIFVEHSPRYVDPGMVGAIVEWVEGPEKVGVFQNHDMDHVLETAKLVGLDMVQLHGQEKPEYCETIQIYYPVIKVISMDYFLFDTKIGAQEGGTGKTFNWDLISKLYVVKPYFLSGGLSAENITDAIVKTSTLPPMAFDVSSKIEESLGIKDFDKLSSLLEKLEI
ncbi:MAG: phosphoribosylanthranilate isomerase [Bacteroidota bacterium]